MFIPITCVKEDDLRCMLCGSVVAFYDDDAAVFYCDACATLLAEALISVLKLPREIVH